MRNQHSLLVVLVLSLCLFGSIPGSGATEGQEGDKIKREDLRYDGKSFAEWRRYLRTELKLEHRQEALKALETFGNNGYAKEVASLSIDLTGNQPWEAIVADRHQLRNEDWNFVTSAIETLDKISGWKVPEHTESTFR